MSKKLKEDTQNKSRRNTNTTKTQQKVIEHHKTQTKASANRQRGKRKQIQTYCELCCQLYSPKKMETLCSCDHLFCKKCLHQYCLQKIDLAELITCPSQNCYSKLNEDGYVYSNIKTDLKQRYKRITKWRQIQEGPTMNQCPQCQGKIYQVSDRRLKCQKCKKNYCKECHMIEHKGNCQSQFQSEHRGYRKCPKCKIFIDKYEGCHHITCTCLHQFCYICLLDWGHECPLQDIPSKHINFVFYSKLQRFMVGFLYIMAFLADLISSAITQGFKGIWKDFTSIPKDTSNQMHKRFKIQSKLLAVLLYPVLFVKVGIRKYLNNIYQMFKNIRPKFNQLYIRYFSGRWLQHCFTYQLQLKNNK